MCYIYLGMFNFSQIGAPLDHCCRDAVILPSVTVPPLHPNFMNHKFTIKKKTISIPGRQSSGCLLAATVQSSVALAGLLRLTQSGYYKPPRCLLC